jgi:hypothetical protein
MLRFFVSCNVAILCIIYLIGIFLAVFVNSSVCLWQVCFGWVRGFVAISMAKFYLFWKDNEVYFVFFNV